MNVSSLLLLYLASVLTALLAFLQVSRAEGDIPEDHSASVWAILLFMSVIWPAILGVFLGKPEAWEWLFKERRLQFKPGDVKP